MGHWCAERLISRNQGNAKLRGKAGEAETHFNRGNQLSALNQFERALASYDAAISAKADYAELARYLGLGANLAGNGDAERSDIGHRGNARAERLCITKSLSRI